MKSVLFAAVFVLSTTAFAKTQKEIADSALSITVESGSKEVEATLQSDHVVTAHAAGPDVLVTLVKSKGSRNIYDLASRRVDYGPLPRAVPAITDEEATFRLVELVAKNDGILKITSKRLSLDGYAYEVSILSRGIIPNTTQTRKFRY